MRASYHIAIGAAGAASLAALDRETGEISAWFLTSWAIDLDHVLDYAVPFGWRGGVQLLWGRFLDGAYQSGRKQLFMMFHSFELLGAAALWQIWVGGPSWVTVAFLAALVHLVCDVFANPAKPLSYFLVFRAAKGFRRELLVNEISASAGSRERVLQGQKTVAVADKALESSANARGDSDH